MRVGVNKAGQEISAVDQRARVRLRSEREPAVDDEDIPYIVAGEDASADVERGHAMQCRLSL